MNGLVIKRSICLVFLANLPHPSVVFSSSLHSSPVLSRASLLHFIISSSPVLMGCFAIRGFNSKSCLLALGLATTLMTADPTGTAEFDVVFPRNNTFEPMPLMPVIFVAQSLEYLVSLLNGSTNASFEKVGIGELPANETMAFLYKGFANLLDTEDMWEFSGRMS